MDCDAISQGIAGGIFNIIKQAYTGDLCEDNQLNGKQFGAGAKTSLDSGAKEWVRVGESASADQITKWAFIFFQVLIHLDMFWALTNVPDDKIHVMGEQTSQALVTCVWSHSVWKVHTVELFTNVASVVVLVCVASSR